MRDDERLYRSAEELEADAAKDPISRMQMWLLREGILDADAINKLEQQVDEEVQRASDRAVMATLPSVALITKYVYSEDLTPMDARFDTQPAATADSTERTMADLI